MSAVAYAAVWMFVFAIPWENTVVIPGFGTVSRLMGVVAVLFALLAAVVSGRLRRWDVFHVAALLFVVWAGTSLFDMNFERLPRKFVTYVQLLGVLLMIWELAPSRRHQLGLLSAYVLGAGVASISTIMVYRSQAAVSRRFAAEGFDPNDLAMTLAMALPMAWYLSVTYRSTLVRWLCRGYLPVALLALGLTGSRGGMLAAMVALLIVPATLTHLSRGKLAIGMALLALSGTLAIAYIPESAMQRLASTGTEMQEGSYGGRLRIWGAGLKAFSHRPIAGYGVGAYQFAVSPILGWGYPLASHNSLLSILVEHGLVGFALYATMFLSVFRAILRLRSLDRRFALVLLAALVVAMLPLGWEDSKSVWFVLAALLGLSLAGPARGVAAAPALGRNAPLVRPPVPRPRELQPIRGAGAGADETP